MQNLRTSDHAGARVTEGSIPASKRAGSGFAIRDCTNDLCITDALLLMGRRDHQRDSAADGESVS